MEDILELILTILFAPFESKYDDTFARIKNIHNKGVRILLRILLIAIPLAVIFGVCCLCSYIFRGYWI
jgi:ABC-type sulfate transport system permease subunit